MSEEKLSPEEDIHSTSEELNSAPSYQKEDNEVEQYDPSKWYNKKWIPFLPAYSSTVVQILMVSFVCFLCPGMFNALSGLGGAGLSDASLADKANVALNSTFSTLGFFSGTICNYLGLRYSLAFGGTGYAIYVASFLCYYHTQNQGFAIFAGAWLGITAACLWGAQGAILMSYPTEKTKGMFPLLISNFIPNNIKRFLPILNF
ncbi:unnamed protein product [[Candida] boidinii]|nr:unnamed protein product [[Candida] boidinii]